MLKRIMMICCMLLISRGTLYAVDTALDAKTDRAYKLLEIGDADQAKKLFVDIIQRKGGDEDALQGLATCLYIKGDYQRAERTLKIMLQRNKNNAYAHALMGGIYFNEKQLAKAEKELQEAVAIAPDRASYQNNFGVILRENGKDEEAKAAFEKALKIDSKYPEANFNMAAVLLGGPDQDLRKAKKYYRTAQKAGYPSDPALEALLQ